MKTTLELPDDLMIEAKMLAAKRQTTFRALVEHALRREVMPATTKTDVENDFIGKDEKGFPCLKPRGVVVTSEMIYKMLEEEDL